MSNVIKAAELFKRNLKHVVDKTCHPVYELLDSIKDLINKKEFDSEEALITLLSKYDITSVNTLLNLDELQRALQTFLPKKISRVIWIPETQQGSLWNYHIGISPWSLTLVSEGWKNETLSVQKKIMFDYQKAELEKIEDGAMVGDPIYVLKNENFYRGIITDVKDESLTITNIDNGLDLFCEKDTIFHPTISNISHPAQALNCCIVTSNEFDESVWCTEFSNVLITVLIENKLKIVRWIKNSSVPPNFTVRLIGINDRNEEADLTKWLEEDILKPWISEGLPSKISPAKFLSQKFQDPFKKKIRSSQMVPTNLDIELEQMSFSEIVAHHLAMSNQSESDKAVEDYIKILQGRKHLFFKPHLSAAFNSTSGYSSPENFNVRLKAEETTARPVSTLEREAHDYKLMICHQFKLFGYCLKKGCVKIHEKPTEGNKIIDVFLLKKISEQKADNIPKIQAKGKKTDNMTVYTSSFNSLDLPSINGTSLIKVKEIMNDCSFYAVFVYPHFEIDGVTITIAQEMSDMNNPDFIKSYDCLTTAPKKGEIVLAYCEDGRFYRGRVINFNYECSEIFLVDFGRTEYVTFQNLKKINERFLRLPFQAVKFQLGGLTHEKLQKAKDYVNAMVGRTFKIQVMDRDDVREMITIKVYVTGYTQTLNELLDRFHL